MGSKADGTPSVPEKHSHEAPSPSVQRRGSGLVPAHSRGGRQAPHRGMGRAPHPATLPFPRREPLCALSRSPQGQDYCGPLSPRDFGLGVEAEGTGLRKRKKNSGLTRAEEPHLASGTRRPNAAVHGPLKASWGKPPQAKLT